MVKPSRVIDHVNWKQLSPYFGDPLCLHHRGFLPGDAVRSYPKQVIAFHQLMWLAVRAYYTILILVKHARL